MNYSTCKKKLGITLDLAFKNSNFFSFLSLEK